MVIAKPLIELMVFELTKYAAREDNLLDQTFVHLMRMIAKIVIIVVGGIYLLRAISGKPLSALLAGLGIGGLAVALAAQDTLKNFFWQSHDYARQTVHYRTAHCFRRL